MLKAVRTTQLFMKKEGEPVKYVIIGNSVAGISAVEGIRQKDKNGEITIISNEPYHTYSRPLISYFLLGKINENSMKYRDDNFYLKNKCTLLKDTVADKIDSARKQVLLTNGKSILYDKLLIATGSQPFIPHFEGLDTVENKLTFMSFDDALKIKKIIDTDKRVLIIGAGLIGLKCAEGILEKVENITVLDLAPRILPAVLDNGGAEVVQKHLESKGVKFRLSNSAKRFEKNTVVFNDDERSEFDVLVLAVGVRPNTALLQGIAEIDKGILINEKSETSVSDIYAAGDCTQTLDVSSGQKKVMALLPNAYMQGECAGINMAGGDSSFGKAVPMNAAGFFGLHIITAGSYAGEEYTETGNGYYKKLFYSDNKLNGYMLVGNVEKAGIYTSLIRERTPLDTIDFKLVCEKSGLMAFTKEDRLIKLGGY